MPVYEGYVCVDGPNVGELHKLPEGTTRLRLPRPMPNSYQQVSATEIPADSSVSLTVTYFRTSVTFDAITSGCDENGDPDLSKMSIGEWTLLRTIMSTKPDVEHRCFYVLKHERIL